MDKRINLNEEQARLLKFLGKRPISNRTQLRTMFTQPKWSETTMIRPMDIDDIDRCFDSLKAKRLAGGAQATKRPGQRGVPKMEYWLTDKGKEQYKIRYNKEPV